jgi:hypothetical protein
VIAQEVEAETAVQIGVQPALEGVLRTARETQ